MIQRDKNQEVKQNVQKIIIRAGQIKQMIKSMFEYILFTQQHYKSHCKETFNNLISFENTISKNCRYQPEKTNMILRLSRQYRQLPGRIEKYAQVNLNKIPLISKQEQLSKYQLQLKKKSQTFSSQFNNYSSSIWSYNSIYQKYLSNCNSLDQIISKFKSYSDPLKFYDKSVTSQYQEMLQTSLNNSKNQETKVTTQLQLLDSKRKFLDELIKQIRELFTHQLHSSLKSIQLLTGLMADVGKDSYNSAENRLNGHDMQITDGNESSKHSEAYELQFQRLNTFTSIIDQGNQIINDFNDILKDKKSKKFNEQIVADHKLFNLRCQNLKKKKQKAFLQCLSLHENLLQMLQNSIKGYKDFEKQFKQKERKIFGINGIDSFKKDFQIYFGSNSYKLLELSSYMVQIPRRAFEQINVWINDNYVIFKEVIQSKKQSISKFNKFYDEIMNQHLRKKAKFQQSDPNDTQISQIYRANIVSSLDQFKFIFSQLEARQAEKDKVVTQKLTLMFKFIKKQMDMCKIQNIVDRYKQNSDTLRHFKVISEAMTVFKGDSIYNILYEEFFSLSLQKNFQSKINKKQYDQAEAILKQKQKIAKKMLKRQIGCCGLIKASPIESEVYSTHKCIIDNHEKTRPHGKLKILKEGLIFEESKWNFFAQKVHILIPKSDVQSIESKTLSNNQSSQQISEGVSIQTQKGPIVFISKTFDELFSALQKIYGETYRKSLAIDKKGLTRNDSTQSGGQGRASMMISYNKQQKVFVQEPVCINPALSKMNLSGSMDKKLKGSNVYPSAISGLSDQAKVLRQKPKSKSQLKQENTIRAMYNKLMLHYDKHQFLPQKFIFLSKAYKSDDRKDYEFHDKQTHNQFLLKQLKKHSIIDSTNGLTLEISYEWKVAYPTSSSLHSFKHGEKIQVNLTMSPPLIHVIQWPHSKQQIFNRHFFYENISQMNQKVRRYIVQNTNQDFLYENIVQKQFDQNDNSEDMFVDNIKQLGVSYPEELEIKQSRIIPTTNDLKIPSSGEIIDFKASNVRSVRSYRKSSIIDTGQGLIKNGQI